jgi:uncharacterized protein (TIRG00374 family)
MVISTLKVAKPLYIIGGLILTLLWLLSNGSVLYLIRYISDEPSIPIRKITEATLVSSVINQITPFSRVGGQPVCAKILSEHSKIKTERELGNIALKYLLESAIIITLGTIGILYYFPADLIVNTLPEIPKYIIIATVAIILSVIVVVHKNKSRIHKLTPDFIVNSLLESKDTLSNVSGIEMLILVPIASIPLLFQSLSVIVFSLSLSIEISPVEILLVLTAATLLNFFIPSTGISGTEESMIAFVLMLADPTIPTSGIVSLVFLTGISTYTMLFILGIISVRGQYKMLKPDSRYLSKAYNK